MATKFISTGIFVHCNKCLNLVVPFDCGVWNEDDIAGFADLNYETYFEAFVNLMQNFEHKID